MKIIYLKLTCRSFYLAVVSYMNTGAQGTKTCVMTEIEGLGILIIIIIYDFTSETDLQCIKSVMRSSL